MTVSDDIQASNPASEFSRFYTIGELTHTSHPPNQMTPAQRYGRIVSAEAIKLNLKALCEDLLDPMAHLFGKVRITSAYRNPLVNAVVGGSTNSAHSVGLAADIQPERAPEIVAFLAKRALDGHLDRVILEQRYAGMWLHVQRLQRDAPAREGKFFISPRADVYQSVRVEAIVAALIAISRKKEALT